MIDLADRAMSHLMAIEQVHGIRIENRQELARFIGSQAENEQRVLDICTSLNFLVAIRDFSGEFSIPFSIIENCMCWDMK